MFFFFNDTATTEIYTLSLHDSLPISRRDGRHRALALLDRRRLRAPAGTGRVDRRGHPGQPPQAGVHRDHERARSEEHTSELQSRQYLVCRLLLEKKKHNKYLILITTP